MYFRDSTKKFNTSLLFPIGFDQIPDRGGALIVFYHGAISIDYVGLMMKVYLEKRPIKTVMDKNLIMLPGSETFFRTFGCFPGRDLVVNLEF